MIGTIHERNWVAKQVMGDFNLPVGYPDLPRVSLTGPSDVAPNNGATYGWVLGVCLRRFVADATNVGSKWLCSMEQNPIQPSETENASAEVFILTARVRDDPDLVGSIPSTIAGQIHHSQGFQIADTAIE